MDEPANTSALDQQGPGSAAGGAGGADRRAARPVPAVCAQTRRHVHRRRRERQRPRRRRRHVPRRHAGSFLLDVDARRQTSGSAQRGSQPGQHAVHVASDEPAAAAARRAVAAARRDPCRAPAPRSSRARSTNASRSATSDRRRHSSLWSSSSTPISATCSRCAASADAHAARLLEPIVGPASIVSALSRARRHSAQVIRELLPHAAAHLTGRRAEFAIRLRHAGVELRSTSRSRRTSDGRRRATGFGRRPRARATACAASAGRARPSSARSGCSTTGSRSRAPILRC